MKGNNVTVKQRKPQKKTAAAVVAVLLCVVLSGVVLAFVLHRANNRSSDSDTAVPVQVTHNAEELRELLFKDGKLTVNIDKDIETCEGFTVKGEKTLTGSGELRMTLSAEWGQALLEVSDGAVLTVNGPGLNCNYVSDGIHLSGGANLIYESGAIKYSDSYGIKVEGKAEIKDISIEKAEYIALFADKGSNIDIKGGSLVKNATNDIYIEKNAVVNISNNAEFTGCMGDAVVNYGTLNIEGGKFTDCNSYTFNNYGELNAAYKGDNGGFIECGNSRLGIFCTRSDAKTEISGVHVNETNRQAVVTVGGETKITDCKFENTGYHAIEIQKGKADIENVTIEKSKNSGIELYTDADVKVRNITIDQYDGIGIASRGGKLSGSDINISNGKKYGISCGNSQNGEGLVSVSDTVISNTEKSGFYVYNKADMKLSDVEVSNSGSRGIYIEDTASLTLSGNSKIHNNQYRGIEARGKFVMENGKIYDNKVENSGAGVYISENGNFTMNGGSIYNNASGLRGGGICVTEGTVTVNNGEIYNNTAKDNGGGLYSQRTAVVNLNNGSIHNNKSEIYGDGIYVASAATKVVLGEGFYVGGNDIKLGNVEAVLKIAGNKLKKHTGSDPLLITPSFSAAENTVVASCKNDSVAKSLAVKMKSGDGSYEIERSSEKFVIKYSTADMDMTGADTVYVSSFKQLKQAVLSTKTKRNIVLKSDIEIEERLRLPGGVTIKITDDGTKKALTRAKGFADNMFVTHYGTGLYLEATKKGNLVLDGTADSSVDLKKAQSLVRVAGSTVIRNAELQNNGSDVEGSNVRGAFLRQLYGDFTVDNSTFTAGLCETGGAIMLDKGKGSIENSSFAHNRSFIGAGAVRAAAGTTLLISDSDFTDNYAGTAGGAVVAVGGAKVTVTDSTFNNNTAENFAGALLAQDEGTVITLKGTDKEKALLKGNSSKTIGAVCVQTNAQLNVNGYIFEGNTATDGRAGAIACNNGTAVLNGTGFYGNASSGSGGAVSVDGGSLTAEKCEFGKKGFGNTSGDKGGAILVTGNGKAHLNGKNSSQSSMAYNKAVIGGAVCVYGGQLNINEYSLTENYAKDGGGAIYTEKNGKSDSNAVSRACTFTANKTDSNGGAVHSKAGYADNNSTFTANSAKNGGAVIAIKGGVIAMTGGGAVFSENTAAANGSAVFVQSDGSTGNISGYAFEGQIPQKIQANGTLTFNNLPGVNIVQGAKGILKLCGNTNAEKITVTPYEYTPDMQLLTRDEAISNDLFADACSKLKVSPYGSQEWLLSENGCLITNYVARIGNTNYATLEKAVEAANKTGGTIYVKENVSISKQLTISADITICNETGFDITVTRSADVTMFYVKEGNRLVIGTLDGEENGSITVDAALDASSKTRIVDNRSGSTFVLGGNATLKNIKSNQWGCAIINRGNGNAYLYGNVTDNTCTGDGGAILQHGEGKTVIYAGQYKNNHSTKADGGKGAVVRVYGGTLEIKGGSFEGNETEYFGGVVYVDDKASAVISGGDYNNNTAKEGSAVYVNGTAEITAFNGITEHTVVVNGRLSFNNTANVNIVIGSAGIVTAKGCENADKVSITPYEYRTGYAVITKSEEMSDDEFETVCKSVRLTQPDGQEWFINNSGCLVTDSIARIGGVYYGTLAEAVAAANKAENGGIIYLLKDTMISDTLTLTKNITILNEPGLNITITRNANKQMFTVNSGARLVLGTNDSDTPGSLTVDGSIGKVTTTRLVNNYGSFILCKNAVMQGAYNNQWGCVLVNNGTAELYGTIRDNICTGAGGAVLQNGGALKIFDGTYQNNTATRVQSGNTTASLGGFLRVEKGTVEIKGGTFTDNAATGDGNAVWVKKGTSVIISGGKFGENQTIHVEGTAIFDNTNGAIFVQKGGGIIEVAGNANADTVTVIPVKYVAGAVVLVKSEDLSDEDFKKVCSQIKVPDCDGKKWIIGEDGKLEEETD